VILVLGKRNDVSYRLQMGQPLPDDLRISFDEAIADGFRVGYQWWRRVPSYDEAEGFVAGCIWWLDEVERIVGFDVPEPDPDVVH
jgi:hypothetical protein